MEYICIYYCKEHGIKEPGVPVFYITTELIRKYQTGRILIVPEKKNLVALFPTFYVLSSNASKIALAFILSGSMCQNLPKFWHKAIRIEGRSLLFIVDLSM